MNEASDSHVDPGQLPAETTILASLENDREEALGRYFAVVQDRLKQIVRFRLDKRLGGRVSESDVIQETYVRAAKRIDNFLEQPDLPFFVWLRLEVTQKLHEVHRFHLGASKRDARKEARQQLNNNNDQTSMCLANHLVAQITSPSMAMQRDEQLRFLQQALEEMNETDREVIALRHFEELSNIETAQVLGLQPSAASKRYLRALQRIGEIMKQAQEINGTTPD